LLGRYILGQCWRGSLHNVSRGHLQHRRWQLLLRRVNLRRGLLRDWRAHV
jgi:hypothetical protein